MNFHDRLDNVIARYDLLQHPFYKAWNEGTLPVAALKDYATEWGAFIEVVPQTWEAVGEFAIAAEERTHVEMWRRFAAALGTDIDRPKGPRVGDLVARTRESCGMASDALGALYAFEAQQPNTSSSKLDGLREHYRDLGEAAMEYFVVHQDDDTEPKIILDRIAGLSPDEQERAVESCTTICRSLWDGLTEIHDRHCPAA